MIKHHSHALGEFYPVRFALKTPLSLGFSHEPKPVAHRFLCLSELFPYASFSLHIWVYGYRVLNSLTTWDYNLFYKLSFLDSFSTSKYILLYRQLISNYDIINRIYLVKVSPSEKKKKTYHLRRDTNSFRSYAVRKSYNY